LRIARTRGHSAATDAAVALFSRLGEHGLGWYALALGGAALDPGRRALYLRALRATAVAFAANRAIKFAARRRRPRLPDLPPLSSTVTELSYPSAHAATFAAARSLPLPAVLVYPAAAAMALSRLYLGVHYPSAAWRGLRSAGRLRG
jgi:membrane-associated phospholipid phosphatase